MFKNTKLHTLALKLYSFTLSRVSMKVQTLYLIKSGLYLEPMILIGFKAIQIKIVTYSFQIFADNIPVGVGCHPQGHQIIFHLSLLTNNLITNKLGYYLR